MTNPLITVIVPTYNHAKYIAEAIDSIIAQTIFTSTKVIVSDDCSSDGTFSIARATAQSLSNVEVIVNEANLGIINHYRKLTELVDTPYVAVLEGDDYWIADDKLEQQLAFLETFPDIGLCFTACIVEDEVLGAKWRQPNWPDGRHRLLTMLDLLDSNPVATFSNCLYRSDRFRDALSYADAKEGYDWLLNLTIAAKGGAAHVAKPSTLYRLHPNGTWTSLNSEHRKAAIIRTLTAVGKRVDPAVRQFINAAVERL
ncbi:glycosyltransferase [Microvirga sp. HBU67558]|uniref:glycosyltransferase n=1 Tax=Microvirga TaxID=186650 RepID=UPI001B388D7E|nr:MULTISPECIES: glycosyltransferase [unclassified Microvirga]MBQ0819616.1 glycosyltransferase [Microvirga sp. HBU67558]